MPRAGPSATEPAPAPAPAPQTDPVRLGQGVVTAAVFVTLAGLVVTASATWFSEQWVTGWQVAGAGLVVAGAMTVRQVKAVHRAGDLERGSAIQASRTAALFLCVALACFALSLSAWFRGLDLDHSATLSVQATTEHCQWEQDDDSAYEHEEADWFCYYRYTVRGRAYVDSGAFGNGPTETLRVDPAHPGSLGGNSTQFQGLFVLNVVTLLIAGLLLRLWLRLERKVGRTR